MEVKEMGEVEETVEKKEDEKSPTEFEWKGTVYPIKRIKVRDIVEAQDVTGKPFGQGTIKAEEIKMKDILALAAIAMRRAGASVTVEEIEDLDVGELIPLMPIWAAAAETGEAVSAPLSSTPSTSSGGNTDGPNAIQKISAPARSVT